MVWYDFVILAILVYCAWQGASRGLVMQLAWIVALIGCFKFADQLSPTIEPYVGVEQPLRHWIAMFILYLGFSLGAFLVARSLNSALEKAKFKDFDRHLGGVFGLLKGVVIALIVTFFAVTLNESLRETVLKSKTGSIACVILDKVEPLTPDDFPPMLRDSIARFKEELDPGHRAPGHPSSLEELFHGMGGSHDETTEQGASDFDSGRDEPSSFDDPWARSPSNGAAPSYREMIESLPGSIRTQVGDSLAREWDRASAEKKQQLMDGLNRAFPNEVPGIVSGFLAATGGQGDERKITELIDRISATYDDVGETRLRIRQYLLDVPPDVQQAVLEDWYADETRSGRDPDPQTDRYTRLDDRILNQLDAANVPVARLSSELRQRLQRSLR